MRGLFSGTGPLWKRREGPRQTAHILAAARAYPVAAEATTDEPSRARAAQASRIKPCPARASRERKIQRSPAPPSRPGKQPASVSPNAARLRARDDRLQPRARQVSDECDASREVPI